jgi:hypothetical protein
MIKINLCPPPSEIDSEISRRQKAKKKAYDQKRPDRALQNKKYYQNNKEKAQASRAEWRARHPEKMQAYRRAWYAKNKDEVNTKAELAYFLRTYGITPADRDRMIEAQDFKCAVCSTDFTTTPHVDHCHATGAVRGMLCARCNHMLGHAKDDPQTLRLGAVYLERFLLDAKNVPEHSKTTAGTEPAIDDTKKDR